MDNTYRITQEQEQILRSFTCERLTVNGDNRDLITYFRSAKGGGLVHKLQTKAWIEDRDGSTAYYVVKNPKGQIVLFFSLKCGALFDPDVIREIMDFYSEADSRQLWEKYLTPEQLKDPRLSEILAFDLRTLFINSSRFRNLLEGLEDTIGTEQYQKIEEDVYTYLSIKFEGDPNQKMIQVKENLSAIELVEFCANDETKKSWKKYDMDGNRMGETLFWYFVVPKMLEVNALVGCEYAFLFAADKKSDGRLVSYYRDAFHFEQMTNLGTAKPSYDRNCYFMGLRLRTKKFDPRIRYSEDEGEDELGLEYYRDEFFDNFNENPEADDFV